MLLSRPSMRFVSCNKSPCFRATISPLNCWNATFDWLLVCQTTKQRSDSSPFLDMSSSSLLRRAPPLLPLQTPLGSSVVSPEAQGAFRGEMAAAEAAQTMATVPSEVAPGVVWGKAREGRGEQSRGEERRGDLEENRRWFGWTCLEAIPMILETFFVRLTANVSQSSHPGVAV